MNRKELIEGRFFYHMGSFMSFMNSYISERKNHVIGKEFIYMNELRNRAIQDSEFMETMVLWFTEGSTLRLRDELLKKIDGLFDFNNLEDFNAFALIDSISLHYKNR